VVTIFYVLFALVFGALSPILSSIAANLRGFTIAPQEIDYWYLLWTTALVGWGYGAFAFIMAAIIRVQVGAIAMMFVLPSTIEQLLGILLKKNQIYLPYTALSNVFNFPGSDMDMLVTSNKAALTVVAYIVVGLIVSLILFVRRDAN
jgi:hypothetical protein